MWNRPRENEANPFVPRYAVRSLVGWRDDLPEPSLTIDYEASALIPKRVPVDIRDAMPYSGVPAPVSPGSIENHNPSAFSPTRLILIIAAVIFFEELGTLLLLNLLPPMTDLVESLIDASLLVVLVVPALYYFQLRPMGGICGNGMNLKHASMKGPPSCRARAKNCRLRYKSWRRPTRKIP